MPRPRTPLGTFGEIWHEQTGSGKTLARVKLRDDAGNRRKMSAVGESPAAATRNLKRKIAEMTRLVGERGEITADSTFERLAKVWLETIEDDAELSASTKYRYKKDLASLVLPAFRDFTLREMSVRRVDHFLRSQATKSYSRAKKAKVVLNLALGMAVRYEALERNPVRGTSRLRRPNRKPKSLDIETVQTVRDAVSGWRTGGGIPGPKPDGQLEVIIEVMLGTSARIGEVLAIRKCDVILDMEPAAVVITGTIIALSDRPTFRQDHAKTSTSERLVLPKFAADALRVRIAKIEAKDDEHLVFFSRNDTPLTPNNIAGCACVRPARRGTRRCDPTPARPAPDGETPRPARSQPCAGSPRPTTRTRARRCGDPCRRVRSRCGHGGWPRPARAPG
ncbi:hypothetical protein GCM10009809_22760 [Isoptericola hypogeus]|uniref:Core-binding (CB) domain-containing protein n=1 Tax=Isoptericola hypogeus TaxID=300179 RepID=A0ABP4VJZ4_9MICO